MNLLHPFIRRAPVSDAVGQHRTHAIPAASPAPAQDATVGCGWFDSSHDLQVGLKVMEHREFDAVVNQIPLSWWLGWELDAARTSVG